MAATRVVEIQWNETGLEIVPKELARTEPDESDIAGPRWDHWRQRKLGRIWMAVMLTLNVEPAVKSRNALKKVRPDVYALYRDRMDIARTLAGYEFEIYDDHLMEGESAGDKYVDLAEFHAFAARNGWTGLEPMKTGLAIGNETSVPFQQNQKNNYLVLVNEVLTLLPGYDATDPTRNIEVISAWLTENDMRQPVQRRTLIGYLAEMADAIEKYDARHQR